MISGKEEFEAKIEGLKFALKWASTEEEDSMVINKIVTVLEHAIVLNESVKKKIGLNVLPLPLNKFFKLAADLESFMSHTQIPKAQNLTYMDLSTFECDLKKSEKKLKGLRKMETDEGKLNFDLDEKIYQMYKDFLTRVIKFKELVVVGGRLFAGFQEGLEYLQRPPIDRTSKLVENIIKANETKRVKSYFEAGCISTHDGVHSISKLHTCQLGLRDHLSK
ncbi:hypothetical protein SO802_007499, partial [Lithocarpus litseifolius]